jgi:hypothetical protein
MSGGELKNKKHISVFSTTFLAVALFFLSAKPAFAQGFGCAGFPGTLGDMMCWLWASLALVPGLFTGFAYLAGLIMGLWGIQKVYDHVNNPHQNSIWDAIKRFVAGGALFALPMVIEASYNSLTGGASNSYAISGFAGTTSAGGLDAIVVRLMSDTFRPMWFVISTFAHLAAIIFIIIGIMRLLKTAQEGPRGPGGIGTIMTFLTGAALFAIDDIFFYISNSLFGDANVETNAALAYTTGMAAAEVNHVHAVISSILAFVMLLGWISVVRGLFILRDVAEGNQQASLMASFTHILGGGLAINLGPVLNAAQATLGLAVYGINFT